MFNYIFWQTAAAMLSVLALAWAAKMFALDKLKAKSQKDAWGDKSKDIVTRMDGDIADLDTKLRSHESRISDLEKTSKGKDNDIEEIRTKLNLLFNGIYAILADDEELKKRAKREFDDAKKF